MPLPKSAQPRCLLLSWRPKRSKAGAEANDFREVLKQRLRYQCRSIEVIDVLEPGTTTAEQREDNKWTEFLAVLTMDYLEACEKEPEHELSLQVLHQLESRQEGKRYWVVRLESGLDTDLTIEVNKRVHAPWDRDRYPQWHQIPAAGSADDFIRTDAGDLSTAVDIHCVRRLKEHQDACEICAPAAPPSRQC